MQLHLVGHREIQKYELAFYKTTCASGQLYAFSPFIFLFDVLLLSRSKYKQASLLNKYCLPTAFSGQNFNRILQGTMR